jgi:hypothetical protein
MKKSFLGGKRKWRFVFLLLGVGIIVAGIFFACHDKGIDGTSPEDEIAYPIPENAEVIVDVA